MKHWKKYLAVIGIGLLAGVIGIGIWQRENAQALWEGMSYTENELKEQIETSKEKTQEVLEKYQLEEIRDLTVEEEEQLMQGKLSVEEAVERIMNKDSQLVSKEEENLSENKVLAAESTTSEDVVQSEVIQSEEGQVVEEYIGKMYTLQATYLSALGAIEIKAREAFSQLPKEDGHLSAMGKLAPALMSEGLALESQCDSDVQTLLSEFESELKEIGADTTAVKTMKEAYQTQKRLKKAYYLSAIR